MSTINKPDATHIAELVRPIETWLGQFRRLQDFRQAHLVNAAGDTLNAIGCRIDVAGEPVSELMLMLLAQIEKLRSTAQQNSKVRDSIQSSPSQLVAQDWLPILNDHTNEFAVAQSLASWRKPNYSRGIIHDFTHHHRNSTGSTWHNPAVEPGQRPLDDITGDILDQVQTRRTYPYFNDLVTTTAVWCPAEIFTRLATGQVDLDRTKTILFGLGLLDWQRVSLARQDHPETFDAQPDATIVMEQPDDDELLSVESRAGNPLDEVPVWIAAMKLLWHHRDTIRTLGTSLTPNRVIADHLSNRRYDQALTASLDQLRRGGFPTPRVLPGARGGFPIATTLLTPISDKALQHLAQQVTRLTS